MVSASEPAHTLSYPSMLQLAHSVEVVVGIILIKNASILTIAVSIVVVLTIQ